MAKPILPDELWDIVAPLLPLEPSQLSERLRDWHEAGVWRKVHQVLLDRLEPDQIDLPRASLDWVVQSFQVAFSRRYYGRVVDLAGRSSWITAEADNGGFAEGVNLFPCV